MCTAFAEKVIASDTEQELFDLHQAENLPVEREDIMQSIYLKDEKGIHRGADAIMTSLAQIYPILKPLSLLIRLPLFKQIADVVYSFVAKRRLLFFQGNSSRLFLLHLTTSFGLLLGLLISFPAWQSDRFIPFVPILGNVDSLNNYSSFLYFGLLASLVLGIFSLKNWSHFALLNIIFIFSLVFADYLRLQPWVLHYLIIFLLLACYRPLKNNANLLVGASMLFVASIYFWSGIQKFNTAFFTETFPWFTESYRQPLGETGYYLTIIVAVFIPLLEALLALSLLFKKTRKLGIVLATLMFMVVISSLAVGHSWNIVVWPWNFVILTMVFILFYKNDLKLSEIVKNFRQNLFTGSLVLICTLIPAGNLFGLTDHYLSWSLYSGHVPRSTITASSETWRPLGIDTQSEIQSIRLEDWSLHTLNIVPYPEVRVFKEIFSKLCQEYKDPALKLEVTERPWFFSHKASSRSYDCLTLGY